MQNVTRCRRRFRLGTRERLPYFPCPSPWCVEEQAGGRLMRHQHDHDRSALNARDVIEGCGILPLELADVSHMTDEAIAEDIAGDPDAMAFTDADGVALRIQMIRSGLSLSQA
jgi:hypothetical protein